MTPDFDSFFRGYIDAFNRSLGDTVDAAGIRAHFADCFVGASPAGIECGANDDAFAARLEQGYAFYKKIGTKRIALRQLEATAIDDLHHHHLVKVFYRADYRKRTGETVSIDFYVTYLVQTREGASRIFAFIAGDEMEAYRKHGLMSPGEPA
jgi:hypothetical protein